MLPPLPDEATTSLPQCFLKKKSNVLTQFARIVVQTRYSTRPTALALEPGSKIFSTHFFSNAGLSSNIRKYPLAQRPNVSPSACPCGQNHWTNDQPNTASFFSGSLTHHSCHHLLGCFARGIVGKRNRRLFFHHASTILPNSNTCVSSKFHFHMHLDLVEITLRRRTRSHGCFCHLYTVSVFVIWRWFLAPHCRSRIMNRTTNVASEIGSKDVCAHSSPYNKGQNESGTQKNARRKFT